MTKEHILSLATHQNKGKQRNKISSYLSHCCIMEISLIISWRSDSTGTCLIATTWPDSLCIALNTLP